MRRYLLDSPPRPSSSTHNSTCQTGKQELSPLALPEEDVLPYIRSDKPSSSPDPFAVGSSSLLPSHHLSARPPHTSTSSSRAYLVKSEPDVPHVALKREEGEASPFSPGLLEGRSHRRRGARAYPQRGLSPRESKSSLLDQPKRMCQICDAVVESDMFQLHLDGHSKVV